MYRAPFPPKRPPEAHCFACSPTSSHPSSEPQRSLKGVEVRVRNSHSQSSRLHCVARQGPRPMPVSRINRALVLTAPSAAVSTPCIRCVCLYEGKVEGCTVKTGLGQAVERVGGSLQDNPPTCFALSATLQAQPPRTHRLVAALGTQIAEGSLRADRGF